MFLSSVRIFAALLAVATVSPSASAAQEQNDAEKTDQMGGETTPVDQAVNFATALTADATSALTNEAGSDSDRRNAFKAVLADGLALDAIGKFMLGDTFNDLDERQSERYSAIFPNYITSQYADQFDEIVGKPLKIVIASPINERDVIVRSEFERKDEKPILVDWRIRRLESGDHKAIDIIVAGVSIMLVKREEFSSFIAANGVDALMDRLEEQTTD